MYKIGDWGRARADFQDAFHTSIQPFYDGFATMMFAQIQIDPFKFDEHLHKICGEYEKGNKSMNAVILERYGEKALKVFERLLPQKESQLSPTFLAKEKISNV